MLYSFTAGADGAYPVGGLTRDSAGNLYGTTSMSGSFGEPQGVVYKIDTTGHIMTVLYGFTGGADGSNPGAGVIRDSAGNLYGTTSGGGNAWGVIYKLNTSYQETVLFAFTGADGYHPASGLARDASGNFYGTTYNGGSKNLGAVYRLDGAGQETVLHSFTGGLDGSSPLSGVCLDSSGNVYGTAPSGGASGAGVVYKLDSAGQETVLYSFTGGADGGAPGTGALVRDTAGNLYGTTDYGGAAGAGVVYKLDANGHETVLYNFTGSSDGGVPDSGVIRDSAGNFYGTTIYGGTSQYGVVYKLDSALHQSVLYSFTGADAGCPTGVVRDLAGNLYGAASGCLTQQSGAVYKLDTTGHFTILYSFTGGADGSTPSAVVLDSAGNLYGTTQGGGAAYAGVVYKLDTAGHQTVLYSFTGGADGQYPRAGPCRDSAGNLYGTAFSGGNQLGGVVFKIKP